MRPCGRTNAQQMVGKLSDDTAISNTSLATASNTQTHPSTMKLKSLLTLALTLAMSGSFVFAEEDTPLAKEMKTVNKNLRTLKRQVEDASKKDENLGLIAA